MRIFMDVSWREPRGSQFTCRLASWLLTGALACALPVGAGAQELVIGASAVRAEGETSHGYSLAYFHRLRGPLLGSFTYLNEGHLGDHHRDGFAGQLWLEAGGAASRFSLAAGAGPYRYFDTVRASSMDGFEDHSGWAALYSLAATWRPSGRWFGQLRFNRVIARSGFDSSSLMAGVGFKLDADEAASAGASGADPDGRRNELMVFAGRTVMNSIDNEKAPARAMEYRRELGREVSASVTLLDEGDTQIAHRRGLAVQAWLEPSFQDDRLTLGVGAGPYLAWDRRRPENEAVLTAAFSLTASWRFSEAWVARATFHRVASFYHRDSDVFLLGLGYRF
jgi:hypothetical protein